MPIDDADPTNDVHGIDDVDPTNDADDIDDVDPTNDADGVDEVHLTAEADEVGQSDELELDDPDERELSGDAALVARAKQRYGVAGAMLAGGMLGLDRLLTGKVKQEAPVEWEAPGEPLDIDRKGIDVPLEDERIVRSRPGPAAAAGATSRRVTRRRRA